MNSTKNVLNFTDKSYWVKGKFPNYHYIWVLDIQKCHPIWSPHICFLQHLHVARDMNLFIAPFQL